MALVYTWFYLIIIINIIVNIIDGEIRFCSSNGSCICSNDELCNLKCTGKDMCKDSHLECRIGFPCIIECDSNKEENACEGAIIDASMATDVYLLCTDTQSCLNTRITCGSGRCDVLCSGSGFNGNSCNGLMLNCAPNFCTITCEKGEMPDSTCANAKINTNIFTKGFECYRPGILNTECDYIDAQLMPFIQATYPPTIITISPSIIPSINPTNIPSSSPTNKPSTNPTLLPTNPTNNPTKLPTKFPTNLPSLLPTSSSPTLFPSNQATFNPTSQEYTLYPSEIPSLSPTTNPTSTSTSRPTSTPTIIASLLPTLKPITRLPSESPITEIPTTEIPTKLPTKLPTNYPITLEPTLSPIELHVINNIQTPTKSREIDPDNIYTNNQQSQTGNVINIMYNNWIYAVIAAGITLCCFMLMCLRCWKRGKTQKIAKAARVNNIENDNDDIIDIDHRDEIIHEKIKIKDNDNDKKEKEKKKKKKKKKNGHKQIESYSKSVKNKSPNDFIPPPPNCPPPSKLPQKIPPKKRRKKRQKLHRKESTKEIEMDLIMVEGIDDIGATNRNRISLNQNDIFQSPPAPAFLRESKMGLNKEDSIDCIISNQKQFIIPQMEIQME